ncbi:MAG: hypothetical protein K2H09_03060 [Treponemataceae bacterium]|nr:hypothetical protein [Treponemataceae bacterium]
MEHKPLSGIERTIVLQYLIDGNVPVTVTPAEMPENPDDGKIHPLSSAVFPVALKAEHISILKEGIILLKNPPQSVAQYKGRNVRVEFYFNRVGLYFSTEMKEVKSGPALVIPNDIFRIEDAPSVQRYDFSAVLHYSGNPDGSMTLPCVPADGFSLFSRPAWSSIPLEQQHSAKKYLERFVTQARESGKAGNGLQLVNICRYLAADVPERMEAVQGRVKPFGILFVNHERIVFGYEQNGAVSLEQGTEYPLKLSFSLRETPSITRDIAAACKVDILYGDDARTRFCADCTYSSLQEEDRRFLYEKATSTLFL